MRDSMLEHEVVPLVVGARIRRWRLEAPYLNASIVTRCRKVFVRRVECQALDVALMAHERFQLLEGVARPYHDFRIESH